MQLIFSISYKAPTRILPHLPPPPEAGEAGKIFTFSLNFLKTSYTCNLSYITRPYLLKSTSYPKSLIAYAPSNVRPPERFFAFPQAILRMLHYTKYSLFTAT